MAAGQDSVANLPIAPSQGALQTTSQAQTGGGGAGVASRGMSQNLANTPSASGTNRENASDSFDILGLLKGLKFHNNTAFALGFLTIIAVLILPMPKWLLDVSLAFSITFSVLILVITLLIPKPTEFNSFPTILLVATLVRLALNVASTRLILSNGHTGIGAAGDVIRAFGGFIMSGNFMIGVIVFLILVLINFVVVTKGSGRIAEVSARFTLDAMPGKQMAIDADLSSGLIDEDTARKRRKELERESNFFGSMDGAAKFVRGDAVAGLIITAINVVGGIIIGVVQGGMTFLDASKTYTYLTVGDGLVSQIPALIVSIAAGMLVTKGGGDESTGDAMVGQLSNYPLALMICSGLMLFMSILPGIPFLPFALLGTLTAASAWFVMSSSKQKEEEIQQAFMEKKRLEAMSKTVQEEPVEKALKIDDIRLELGYGLLPLIKGDGGDRSLAEQVKTIRRQLAVEMGFLMPSVRIKDNLSMSSNAYTILIKEIPAGAGDIRTHMLLCMNPSGMGIDLPGEDTTEPSFGLPARWITSDNQTAAENMGYTVVSATTVVVTHLTEVIKDNMADLLTIEQMQRLIAELPDSYQKLVQDSIPSQISFASLLRVLQNLLRERVSIRDLTSILDAVFESLGSTRNISNITEHVRSRLARQICQASVNSEGVLEILLLSPEWERIFYDAIVGDGESRQLALAPSQMQEFVNKLHDALDDASAQGHEPVLLTSPTLRTLVRAIVERSKPNLMVVSQNEIHPKIKLATVGQV